VREREREIESERERERERDLLVKIIFSKSGTLWSQYKGTMPSTICMSKLSMLSLFQSFFLFSPFLPSFTSLKMVKDYFQYPCICERGWGITFLIEASFSFGNYL
jgi:hypothetical protein